MALLVWVVVVQSVVGVVLEAAWGLRLRLHRSRAHPARRHQLAGQLMLDLLFGAALISLATTHMVSGMVNPPVDYAHLVAATLVDSVPWLALAVEVPLVVWLEVCWVVVMALVRLQVFVCLVVSPGLLAQV